MSESFLTFAKELILEGDDAPKFGCLMAMISPDLSGQFIEWAFDHIDPDDVVPENGKTGYEDEPHITIIYGLHDNITADDVLSTIKDFGPIHVTLGKISKFKQDELDVLKIDVESQDLHDLNALLANKFKDSYTNKFPDYHPHMTLAYVKKGAAEDLDNETFDGFEMDINLVTYSYPEAKDKKTLQLTEARQIPYQWEIKNVYLDGDRVSASKPIPSPSADGALAKFIWLMLSDHERVSRDTISKLYKKAKEIGGYTIKKLGMDAPREHPEPQNNFSHYPPAKDKPKFVQPVQATLFGDSMQGVKEVVPTDYKTLPDSIAKAFDALAEDQRCAPEDAMMRVTPWCSGIWSSALEHVGDLTHRMAQHPKFFGGGHEWVNEKVRKALYWLTNAYGYEKEVMENLAANYSVRHEYKKIPEDWSFDQYVAHVKKLAKEYADEHAKLVVYNRAQWLAREAAIAIGHLDVKKATSYLQELKEHLAKDWTKFALTYYLDKSGALVPYNP